jgi:hypothetical protein
MNERYAIDPDAPASSRELKLLLDQFGMQTGRFVCRYPTDWMQLLWHKLQAISPVERARMEDLLARRRGWLVPTDTPYQSKLSWANNAAIALQRHQAFAAVIGQPSNGFGWKSVDRVLYDDECALPPGLGAHVPMKATAYAECVRPLFHASAEVFLVDPYFALRDRNGSVDRRRWPVLLALLTEAEKSSDFQTLRIVLEKKQIQQMHGDEKSLVSDLESSRITAGISRINLEYELRDDVGHGRYIFSLHGGLQFDQGFEERRESKNHVHWLSRPELEPLIQEFGRNTMLAAR